ncbi:MAG: Ditrans,polycis-undecaprenyl-diphosphate synthase ((2E,6E)-farnesyl-diphosphate specific) [bacterium ADurb.Bin478]|nr:MAG: Ditrans,polycis-undecaprenyl-diphosphate synthase ((2E,6E)-farnesyl-diphosphate specific) [bacterium ADurb.Bin478]
MDLIRIDTIKKTGRIPRHVAVIMDGNGRWATRHGLPRIAGHKQGVEAVRAVVEAAGGLGIQTLTLYTFSTENWKRPQSEITDLMSLLLRTITNETAELMKKNVRLTVIGDLAALPSAPRMGVRATIAKLRRNTGLNLNLALSYSGRQEIVQAVRKIAAKVEKGELTVRQIDEELIAGHLQTHEMGDPDLLIRTSGEQRLSNFLLWQIAYTELYITPTLWPDFDEAQFLEAVEDYAKRERRYGKTREQLQSKSE